MKKMTQRLTLEKQSIRVLSFGELRMPRGGQSDPGEPSGGDPGRPSGGDPGLPASHDHCTAAPPAHP